MIRCNQCCISKVSTAFSKQKRQNGTFGRRSVCKQCRSQNQSKVTASESAETKLRRRSRFLLKTYGITIEDYNHMLTIQNFTCASCKRHQSMFKKALVVDHNHKTGKVRGILCSGCNLALGNISEDPDKLIKLAAYIRGVG